MLTCPIVPVSLPPLAAFLALCRAAARLHLKDHKGALGDADAALKINPLHVKAHFRRATALQALGDNSAALAAAQAALQIEPGNTQIKRLAKQLSVDASVKSKDILPRNLLPPLFKCAPFEAVPPSDGICIMKENLLLLFHGLGDTPTSYARFARTISLPQTAAVSLGAPHEVPFSDGGRSWFTVFDESMELIPGALGEKRRITEPGRHCRCYDGTFRYLGRAWVAKETSPLVWFLTGWQCGHAAGKAVFSGISSSGIMCGCCVRDAGRAVDDVSRICEWNTEQ